MANNSTNTQNKGQKDEITLFTDGVRLDYEPDEYLDDPYHSMKNADENILRGIKDTANAVKTDVKPSDEGEDSEENPDATMADVMEQIDEMKKTGDPKKAKDAWVMFIDILKGKSDYKEPIASFITRIYYKNPKSQEAQESKNLLKAQMSRLLMFPVGLWVLVNWWYLINHTTYTVNVMKYTEYLPGLIKPIFEAPLYAIDVLNYYLINMREDKELSEPMCYALKTMWSWRPVVFFIMLLIFSSIYAGVDLKDAITVTAGLSSSANGFMFAISIFAFFYFNLCESRLGLILRLLGGGLTGIVVSAVLFLLGFILMLVFCSVATGFYSAFIIFLSFFSIIVFGFPNILSEIQNVFRVVNSAPVSNPNTTDYFTKIKNILFQDFMNIILATFLIPILIHQIGETYHVVKNQNMMMTMMMFQIFILAMYFRKVTYPILHPIFDILERIFNEKKAQALAKMTLAKEIMKETTGINAAKNAMANKLGASSFGDAFSKLSSTQGEKGPIGGLPVDIPGLDGNMSGAAGAAESIGKTFGVPNAAAGFMGK